MTRLEELKKQATEDILGVKILNADIFAELLVKECAVVCTKESMLPENHLVSDIKSHLGI